MPALTRRVAGRIAYRDTDGVEQGWETFTLASHGGGHLLQALCVLDDVRLVRDVTLAMDRDWRPVDGFCRLIRRGVREAALWFDVRDDGVRIEGWLGKDQPLRQMISTAGRLAYLGLHPLQGDALIVEQRGIDDPGQYRTVEALTNSISPNGDEAVGARPVGIEVAYIGEADVAVPAGSFAARHYRLRWRADWPPADLWVRRADCLFLRMTWEKATASYQLDRLDEDMLY
jgi:hypothetical protein